MDKKIIYDLGLHKGEDTEYYLARGYKVVAVEANPDLVSYCREKFKKQLESEDLIIIHGAIFENDEQATVKFFKNKKLSVWGTVVKSWADRNKMLGAESVEIEVPVVNFNYLFSKYGSPYYLKIDIEGMDLVCLKKLLSTSYRPKFISIESEKIKFSSLVEEFKVLQSLGYKRFFIQQQANIFNFGVPLNTTEGPYVDFKFTEGSTGPFGSDLGQNWLDTDSALKKYKNIFKEYKYFGDHSILRKMPKGIVLINFLSKFLGRPLPGWYDTHARMDSSSDQ